MIYLEIHGIKDELKIFKCGTRYDWYLIEKNKSYKHTFVLDEEGITYELLLNTYEWIPNKNIKKIYKLIDIQNNIKLLNDSSYHSTRNYVKEKPDNEHKYPCVHSTPKSGIRYMYSSKNDKGHFGISKIIFGESGIHNAIIDIEGKYGMTQGAMAIKVNNLEEARNIKNAIESIDFKTIFRIMFME